MPRASGRACEFECLSCKASFRGFWWYGDSEWVTQSNEKEVHRLQDSREGHTTDCSAPHISRLEKRSSNLAVQVRQSQRAVIYRFADGSWAQPGSNDPNDPVAQQAIREGGIREEAYHYRELVDFNKGMAALRHHPNAGYNDVIDWNEASLRQRDTETIEIKALHDREALGRKALEIIGGAGSQGRYEKALRAHRERGGR